MDGKKERSLRDYPKPITYECNKKIMEQMEKNVCRINIEEIQGTGLFCKIPFPDKDRMLPVFITNNHIIDNNLLKLKNKRIKIDIKEETEIREIKLKDRLVYTNEEYDITIIEIKDKDNINDFFELDDIIINDILNDINKNKEYINETIYTIHYCENKLSVSYGILYDIFDDKKYNFNHKCNTKDGSSGSPILNMNNKLIGVHKRGCLENEFNEGVFINYPIKDFIKINCKKNKNNEINFLYKKLVKKHKKSKSAEQKEFRNRFRFNKYSYDFKSKLIELFAINKTEDKLININTPYIIKQKQISIGKNFSKQINNKRTPNILYERKNIRTINNDYIKYDSNKTLDKQNSKENSKIKKNLELKGCVKIKRIIKHKNQITNNKSQNLNNKRNNNNFQQNYSRMSNISNNRYNNYRINNYENIIGRMSKNKSEDNFDINNINNFYINCETIASEKNYVLKKKPLLPIKISKITTRFSNNLNNNLLPYNMLKKNNSFLNNNYDSEICSMNFNRNPTTIKNNKFNNDYFSINRFKNLNLYDNYSYDIFETNNENYNNNLFNKNTLDNNDCNNLLSIDNFDYNNTDHKGNKFKLINNNFGEDNLRESTLILKNKNKFCLYQSKLVNNKTLKNQKMTKRVNSTSQFNSNEDTNLKKFELIPPKKGYTRGLEINISGNYYINAILQCLANIEKLTKFFLGNKKIISKNKNKLSNVFLEVIENLWKKDNKPYDPQALISLINRINPLFMVPETSDSKDLILFLLKTLHNELNKAKVINQNFNNKIYQDDFNKYYKNYFHYFKKNFQSIISGIFYGLHCSKISCNNCKKLSLNIEYFNILSIPPDKAHKNKKRIEKYVTIIECLEYYRKHWEEEVYCNNCKMFFNGINNCFLLKEPKVLIIELKKNNELNCDIKIDFEEIINLKEFFYFKNNITYKLIGVISKSNQFGFSIQFSAFCKSFINNNWYKYNDSIVSLISFKEIKKVGMPLLLFYSSE